MSIAVYLESKGFKIRHNRTRCPIHGGNNPSAFEIKGERFRCHSCGAWGDLHDLKKHFNDPTTFTPSAPRPMTDRQKYEAERARYFRMLDDPVRRAQAEYWLDNNSTLTEYLCNHSI